MSKTTTIESKWEDCPSVDRQGFVRDFSATFAKRSDAVKQMKRAEKFFPEYALRVSEYPENASKFYIVERCLLAKS